MIQLIHFVNKKYLLSHIKRKDKKRVSIWEYGNVREMDPTWVEEKEVRKGRTSG